jgi:hypothetical protein
MLVFFFFILLTTQNLNSGINFFQGYYDKLYFTNLKNLKHQQNLKMKNKTNGERGILHFWATMGETHKRFRFFDFLLIFTNWKTHSTDESHFM